MGVGGFETRKRNGGSIVESKSLIHGYRMGSNSPGKLKIPGSLAGRITKTSIYGEERKSETDLRIGKIRKSLCDFAKQAKNKINGKESNIMEETNSRKVGKLEIRENESNFTWGISDFEGGGFTESSSNSIRRRKIQEELRKGIESKEYVIAAYGEDTEEYLEEKLDLDEIK